MLLRSVRRLSPTQLILLSFLSIILFGSFVLSLPVSSATSQSTDFFDSLFTATSAVCVTGLSVKDTGLYWSKFGQVVILILIQIGGLGFLTLTTLATIMAGKRIDLKTRILMKESLGQNRLQGILKFTRSIVLLTLGIEGLGALVLSFVFIPEYGFLKGIFFSVFHSISAYCNAGFDLNGNFNSFIAYKDNVLLNLALMSLILLGGIGFTVPFDLWKKRSIRRLSLNSKIILVANFILLFGGMALFLLFEFNNPLTLKGESLSTKLLGSAFQSVTCRTAGFNTLDLTLINDSSKLLMMLLMFIGGSPASTAGGVKVTTIVILILVSGAVIQNKKDIEFFHKRISFKSVNKAIAILVIATFVSFFGTLFIAAIEQEKEFVRILFEVISAMGTSGLSLNLTGTLSGISKMILIVIMFIGRVGILTVLVAFSDSKIQKYKYPEEQIII